MLALTEASLWTTTSTPVRAKKRQDHEDEGQVTIHMRTRLGGGLDLASIKCAVEPSTESNSFTPSVSPLPDMDAGGTGWGVRFFSKLFLQMPRLDLIEDILNLGDSLWKTSRGMARRLPVGDGLNATTTFHKGRPSGRPFFCECI